MKRIFAIFAIAVTVAGATATAYYEEPHGLAHLHPQIAYAADTGAEIGRVGEAGAATRTGAVMAGLHEAHFAAAPLRLLFFLCGVMGAATVASGLVLWTVARAPKESDPEGFGLRLVRVLNPESKQPFQAGEYERRLLNLSPEDPSPVLYRPGRDGTSGYRGRSGIYELIVVDDQMRTMIHDGASEQDLEKYARQATPSIRDDGRAKVLRGETTIEEVLRVTRED